MNCLVSRLGLLVVSILEEHREEENVEAEREGRKDDNPPNVFEGQLPFSPIEQRHYNVDHNSET